MSISTPSISSATVVVGIGASAGGVEALSGFFDHGRFDAALLDVNVAFVIAMHLSAHRESQLPEILSRRTTLRVLRAEQDMPIETGTIYVITPGQVLSVKDKKLQLSPINVIERLPSAVDRLFNSLAEDYAENAIGVVLSGTGADGALGLKAIKERGGLTIAQGEDGSVPMFSGMPRSAMATGVVDLQLPVEDIATRLSSLIASMENASGSGLTKSDALNDGIRQEICALLQIQVGHDFSGYKSNTFFRRVQRRMQVLQIESLDSYLDCLKHTPTEVTLLFHDLLISVTSFFRDSAAFAMLEQQIVPLLFEGKSENDEVRVWVPGCATGEEAYSLGMLLLEHAQRLGRKSPDIRVFASDIDGRALAIARKGRYPSVLLEGVTAERRGNFFVEDRRYFTVQKSLREIVTFSDHNALRDPPFSRIDLVSCRNLLIYLAAEFQDRILPILHYALRPEGFLFVGVAEGATRHSTLFTPISREHRVFRRLPSATPHAPAPLLAKGLGPTIPRHFETGWNDMSSKSLRTQIEARILTAHAPPYVLVNGQGDALFYSGRTGNFLEFAPGAPSKNLLNNARKELRLLLRRGLHEAVETQLLVHLPEAAVHSDEGQRRIQISIEPFDQDNAPLYLVLFHDHGAVTTPPDLPFRGDSQNTEQLQHELHDAREQLQSTYEEFETAIEELRVSNEELMSVNEELQSSNEELETSKEELQSVNEEMQTINTEMSHHVAALDQSNADLRGLLESTRIATVFLDKDLAIRSFTPAATEIFTLIPTDRGRLITDLSHQLSDVNMLESLQTALMKGKPAEISVSRKDSQRHYLMSLLPYGAADERGGVVMTFVDITPLAEADARHKTMIGELNHRVRNMLAVVSAMATQTLQSANTDGSLDHFLDRLHSMARTYKLLTETDWSYMSLSELFREELSVIGSPNRYVLTGPPVKLLPREALALGMVVHELATNALKHGALSNDEGMVAVSWKLMESPNAAIAVRWQEKGGPTVVPATRRGFGSILIERQLAYELDGKSVLDFTPDGLIVSLDIPRLAQAALNKGSTP
ncbi:chemotaxis protein CheB [Rhodanobacter sp. A1T4]|uniref:chemotaxis protein CheB n=1 Tax=Rhodanobacter sp. A1T4 TaxID=2723087 RepID=UPI00160B6EDB|nr:chemotaxis protein CheB [Rhodanobacter sp. A1T4]MBB6249033.1 two-component system CheB/CheR fusion protein [Rhodanobacter sp. A1T4]